jgi:predicted dehydrogenase
MKETSAKIRCGVIGVGFVGPHHIDAMRRLGFVEVVALATSSSKSARRKAAQLHVSKAYDSWEEMLEDSEIDVVDVATPTKYHFPIAIAAIARGKHVIVDKPLALNSTESKQLMEAAAKAGVINAVTFNIRYNAVLQQMRVLIERGEVGKIHLITGHYLQEWLLKDTDFSWRLDPDESGAVAMVADAGVHWFDLAQHLTGLRVTHILADLHTIIPIRQKPVGENREAFAAASGGQTEPYSVRVPDLGSVLMKFDNGARGVFTTTSLAAGHKNDLRIEVNGSQESMRWEQERPNELWIGRRDTPSQMLLKDPALLDESVRHYATLPGGHNEAWPDAFRNLMKNIFAFIAERRDPRTADGVAFPTFQEGWRAACVTDAIQASHLAGGRWTKVNYD